MYCSRDTACCSMLRYAGTVQYRRPRPDSLPLLQHCPGLGEIRHPNATYAADLRPSPSSTMATPVEACISLGCYGTPSIDPRLPPISKSDPNVLKIPRKCRQRYPQNDPESTPKVIQKLSSGSSKRLKNIVFFCFSKIQLSSLVPC